jgi:flagellar basal-body rod protein FlgB
VRQEDCRITKVFDSTTIPILEQVVNFAQARHQLLASNVANLDTPGYRVRDLSLENFQQALASAVEARDAGNEPITSNLVGPDPSDPMRQVRESIRSILYHDNSDVGMEQQVAEITKNQMMHDLALTIMRHQFQQLQTAIQERV